MLNFYLEDRHYERYILIVMRTENVITMYLTQALIE